jgi:hypothetical protein
MLESVNDHMLARLIKIFFGNISNIFVAERSFGHIIVIRARDIWWGDSELTN